MQGYREIFKGISIDKIITCWSKGLRLVKEGQTKHLLYPVMQCKVKYKFYFSKYDQKLELLVRSSSLSFCMMTRKIIGWFFWCAYFHWKSFFGRRSKFCLGLVVDLILLFLFCSWNMFKSFLIILKDVKGLDLKQVHNSSNIIY